MKRDATSLCATCCEPVVARQVTPGCWRKFNADGSPHLCQLPVQPYGEIPGHQAAETSRDAARSVVLDLANRQARVLLALKERGERGATADELVADLGGVRNGVAPRLTELHEAGLIERTDERRPTPAGASAYVYKIAS